MAQLMAQVIAYIRYTLEFVLVKLVLSVRLEII